MTIGSGAFACRRAACLSRFLLHVLAPAVFSGLTYAVSTGCWTSILGLILQIQSRIPWHTGVFVARPSRDTDAAFSNYSRHAAAPPYGVHCI